MMTSKLCDRTDASQDVKLQTDYRTHKDALESGYANGSLLDSKDIDE